eukprot:NODE_5962_length_1717_cov_7.865409.p2 GENE.NODE_5962_length_1717_cov_7.865409~~NODE_5962_length_1717_cov_7.865409.p2  ORF type:complete len:281 (+),score=69.88 NODE_5962_length_1717_cov_7.865409:715-1557(+)
MAVSSPRCARFVLSRRRATTRGRIIDAAAMERIQRICHLHENSQDMFASLDNPSNFTYSEKTSKYSWGCRVEGLTMVLAIRATLDFDVVRFLALNQEHDVSSVVNKDVKVAEPLGAQTPHDTVWRIIESSAILLGDSIVTKSSLDALDEACPAIYWFDIAEAQATQEVRGQQVPPPRAKHTRSPYSVASRLTPSWDASGEVSNFVFTYHAKVTLNQTAANVLAGMPCFLINAGISAAMSKSTTRSSQYLSGPADALVARMATSSRSPFYAKLRERLARTF